MTTPAQIHQLSWSTTNIQTQPSPFPECLLYILPPTHPKAQLIGPDVLFCTCPPRQRGEGGDLSCLLLPNHITRSKRAGYIACLPVVPDCKTLPLPTRWAWLREPWWLNADVAEHKGCVRPLPVHHSLLHHGYGSHMLAPACSMAQGGHDMLQPQPNTGSTSTQVFVGSPIPGTCSAHITHSAVRRQRCLGVVAEVAPAACMTGASPCLSSSC